MFGPTIRKFPLVVPGTRPAILTETVNGDGVDPAIGSTLIHPVPFRIVNLLGVFARTWIVCGGGAIPRTCWTKESEAGSAVIARGARLKVTGIVTCSPVVSEVMRTEPE